MAEQRCRAVLAVIKDGRTVTEVAAAAGVSRQTLHAWLGKYEAGGLEGLVDGSHRPLTSPQQMPRALGSTTHHVQLRRGTNGAQQFCTRYDGCGRIRLLRGPGPSPNEWSGWYAYSLIGRRDHAATE